MWNRIPSPTSAIRFRTNRLARFLLPSAMTFALSLASVAAVPYAAAQVSFPHMAPLSKYLSSSVTDEMALARSAAPASISDHAEVLTLSRQGYKVSAEGHNGFVCLVERSWDHRFASSQFWNPAHRVPICYNPKSAHTILPIYLQRTQWVFAGVSRVEMAKRTRAEIASKKISIPANGAMSYMMSKGQYICSANGGCSRFYPHLMFFFPKSHLPDWGTDLKGVPVLSGPSSAGVTLYFVLVPRWSDQTPSPAAR
jgi:hypothetical protein